MRKMGIWREYLIEKLADKESAINYLQAILEDYQVYGDSTVVLRSLHTVVKAQGGTSELAKQTDMDPQVLSKVLSNKDTPLIDVFTVVLKALDYQLSIQPIDSENLNLRVSTDVLETQIAEN